MSLHMDGLRAADPEDPGGHQDVPASEHTREHGGIQMGEAFDWGQMQGIMPAAESPPRSDSQRLSLGDRDPQEEKKQPQAPGHVHGGGWKMRVLLSTSALVCLPWLVLVELISKRTRGGTSHKSSERLGGCSALFNQYSTRLRAEASCAEMYSGPTPTFGTRVGGGGLSFPSATGSHPEALSSRGRKEVTSQAR